MPEQHSEQWPLEPNWLEQIHRDTDAMVAKAANTRRAFLQGLATGISASVIVMVAAWTLWP